MYVHTTATYCYLKQEVFPASVMDMSWTKIFWTGNLALVLPSLALVVAQHSFTDKSAAKSSVGETTSSLRFWQFRKRYKVQFLPIRICNGETDCVRALVRVYKFDGHVCIQL